MRNRLILLSLVLLLLTRVTGCIVDDRRGHDHDDDHGRTVIIEHPDHR